MNSRPLPCILSRIRNTKEKEVSELLDRAPLGDWVKQARESLQHDIPRNFLQALTKPAECVNLIAEIKKASPSKGIIRSDFNPPVIARFYEEGGAAAISCLTDKEYFQGCNEFLVTARAASCLPILRKDFFINPVQIAEARTIGADAVLLIARMLTSDELEHMLALTTELGMTALTEVHDEEDINKAIAAEAPLIGINNRDLDTFVVDTDNFSRLRSLIPQNIPVVAESGIFTHDDCLKMSKNGASAVLVGESLMRQDDLVSATRILLGND